MTTRRTHLTQLARVLPRADQIFAQPRQRLDVASDKLASALRRNLQEHRRTFGEAAALLRPRPIRHHITVCGERTGVLGKRLDRAHGNRLVKLRAQLEGISRVLDGISYKGVLERGFVLVRSADGAIRRRADAVKSGEALTLTFVDGTRDAVAGGASSGAPKPRVTKPSGKQGDLF